MSEALRPGQLGWHDLTVDDAPRLRDFYRAVAGWTVSECPMGGYSDYVMHGNDGTAVAGVCHRRGPNSDLPAQWVMYVVVGDVEAAAKKAAELGGTLLRPLGPSDGMGRTAFVRDPAGAVFALFQPDQD